MKKWSSGIRAEERVSVIINGTTHPGFSVFASKYSNVCAATGIRFLAGTRIAFGTVNGQKVCVVYPQTNALATIAEGYQRAGKPIPPACQEALNQDQSHIQRQEINATIAATPKKSRKPYKADKYQRAFTDAFLSTESHLACLAGAGSGKTTVARETVREARALAPHCCKRVLVLMFNSKNRHETNTEMQLLPPAFYVDQHGKRQACTITVHSTHSYGLSRIQAYWAGKNQVKLDKGKLFGLLTDQERILRACGIPDLETLNLIKWAGMQLCNKARLSNLPYNASIARLLDVMNNPCSPVECGNNVPSDLVCRLASYLLHNCIPTAGKEQKIDFIDMLWWTAQQFQGISFSPHDIYDQVIADESQDFNPCQQSIIAGMVASGSRVSIVGDPCQAINGFAMADCRSIYTLQTMLGETSRGCEIFPMPINRRSTKAVIGLANTVGQGWENLQAAPNAEEGVAGNCTIAEMVATIEPGDAIISRTNAPIIDIGLRLLEAGKPVNILGGQEAADEIVGCIEQVCKGRTLATVALCAALQTWEETQLEKFKGVKGMGMRCSAILNQCRAIRLIASRESLTIHGRDFPLATSRDIVGAILALIVDENADRARAVNLMSGHRCKGLQFHRVYNLTPQLYPHPRAESEESKIQEINLLGVVITRAEEEIWTITDCKVDETEGEA